MTVRGALKIDRMHTGVEPRRPAFRCVSFFPMTSPGIACTLFHSSTGSSLRLHAHAHRASAVKSPDQRVSSRISYINHVSPNTSLTGQAVSQPGPVTTLIHVGQFWQHFHLPNPAGTPPASPAGQREQRTRLKQRAPGKNVPAKRTSRPPRYPRGASSRS